MATIGETDGAVDYDKAFENNFPKRKRNRGWVRIDANF
jgi:hypothetical protein